MVFLASLIGAVLAQGPTTPLAGQVVGPGGKPVSGAEVLLTGLDRFATTIVARGHTDDAGRFSLERPAGPRDGRRPRAVVLWVVAPGFRASATHDPSLLVSEAPVRVGLEAGPGA